MHGFPCGPLELRYRNEPLEGRSLPAAADAGDGWRGPATLRTVSLLDPTHILPAVSANPAAHAPAPDADRRKDQVETSLKESRLRVRRQNAVLKHGSTAKWEWLETD
jgi:hypothetical protein